MPNLAVPGSRPIDLASAPLRDIEDYIRPRLLGFIEAGVALLTIRQRMLYKDAGFGSFEVYVRDRWQMDISHARHLCDAAQVAQITAAPGSTNATIVAPVENEAQARELAPLLSDPDELRAVWSATIERTSGSATAAAIRAVRREREAARTGAPPPRPQPQVLFSPPPEPPRPQLPPIPPDAHRVYLLLTQAVTAARAAGGAAALRAARDIRPDVLAAWYPDLADAAAFAANVAEAAQG